MECTNKATKDRRVTRGSGLALRMVVSVCDDHAQALDSGAPVLVEFVVG